MSKRSKRKGEAHVRLYRHELMCPAYRSLTPDARALLVEMRALFNGQDNRIFLGAREMARRLGVSPRRASAARDQLLATGFITILVPGSFSRKAGTRRAAEYALLSEPIGTAHAAEKTYMKWQPEEKNAVVNMTTVGSHIEHGRTETATEKQADRAQIEHGQGPFSTHDRSQYVHTDKLPGGGRFEPLLLGALNLPAGSAMQFKFCLAAALLNNCSGELAA